MPLKFVLRPNEKVIINGAVIGAGDRPGSFFLYNTANFLRGREVLKEEQIDCIEKKLYFVIQLVYIFPEDSTLNLQRFASILEETRAARPDVTKVLDEITRLVEGRNYYRALKLCRKMFKDGSGATVGEEGGDGAVPPSEASERNEPVEKDGTP
ncbi:flagellar biosynthesis repressor FlbT [Azospirillum picis]|uniref:Flagellar protein FlbT n=1 Tax=Azospirillum picis TaxID=488438 RepID=A0ABU0MGV7_9PROT|nr:flagellar biosynthesis repressor FlbT [Azospirillum picis]MBP2299086.1 flagellar protein FlbT [Azospirillum picis]MDQ0532672.1 flagellar protein FlbT [Azospirillum picis]